jgi:hypothetical protein
MFVDTHLPQDGQMTHPGGAVRPERRFSAGTEPDLPKIGLEFSG